MTKESESELDRLIKRVEALELDNARLSQQVDILKENALQARSATDFITASTRGAHKTTHKQIDDEVYLDRLGNPIELGDHVYIITPGAHTARSRRGTVDGFDKHRNRVFVLDECGIQQERAPKNLRIESSNSRRST